MALSWAAWIDAFKVDCDAHADLTSTTVTTYPPPDDLRSDEGVTVIKADGGHQWHSMGPNYRDGFTVECRLWSRKPDTDATAEMGKVSRTRTETMLDAVVDVLEDSTSTIYTHCKAARVERWSWVPQQWEDGGWRSAVEFSIAVVSLP